MTVEFLPGSVAPMVGGLAKTKPAPLFESWGRLKNSTVQVKRSGTVT